MPETEEKTSNASSLKGILAKQFAAVQQFVFNVSFVAYLYLQHIGRNIIKDSLHVTCCV